MSEFVPFQELTLSWRFKNFHAEDLCKIHPLNASSCKEKWIEIFLPLPNPIEGYRISANENATSYLVKLQIDGDEEIYVMWRSDTAIIPSWNIFLGYWDDFCYPSSDDVLIAPIIGSWRLQYLHEEIFIFNHN